MKIAEYIWKLPVQCLEAQDLVNVKVEILIKHEPESNYLHVVIGELEVENGWHLTDEELSVLEKAAIDKYLTYYEETIISLLPRVA